MMSLFLILLILSLFTSVANASQLAETLQVHGFGSQTYTLSSHNNFFGKSSGNGSFEFTEVGINSSSRPIPELQVSVQVLSRRAGKADNGDPRLDYALFDYSFISKEKLRSGVRLGVIKNPLGLYNETRDISFTRPGIFLPQSIYFDRTRNLALSANGMHIFGEYRNSIGDIFLLVGAGNPRIGDPATEVAILGGEQAGSLDARISYTARLLYEFDGGRVRLSVTAIELNTEYDPAEEDSLLAGKFHFQPYIFSLQYNAESWSLTSEYAIRSLSLSGFGSDKLPDRSFRGQSYYIQGEYKILKDWGVLVRYDVLYQDKDDKNGEKFSSEFKRPGFSRFAKDLTFGLAWDITPSVSLRTEYHNVNGTAWVTPLDNTEIAKTKQFWDMVSFLASYRF
ncbi:MAG: hypothetical protein ACE5FU_05155 [Nitrospinota bacterium]